MNDSTWSQLGVAADSDSATIRRAYAVKLKQTRPDEDPAGFARLRTAYESALKFATAREASESANIAAPIAPASAPHDAGPSRHGPASPAIADDALDRTAIAQRITELQRNIVGGDVNRACEQLLAARGADALPITPWMHLQDMMAARLAQDADLDDAMVEGVAAKLGWLGNQDVSSKAVLAVRLRVDAARWLADQRRRARRISRFFGAEQNAAAAAVVGSGAATASLMLAPYPRIRQMLAEAHSFGPYATHHLDAKRLTALLRLTENLSGQRHRRFAAAGLAAAALFFAGHMVLGMAFVILIMMCSFDIMRPVLAGAFASAAIYYTYLAAGGDPDIAWNAGVAESVAIGVTALVTSIWKAVSRRGSLTLRAVLVRWLRRIASAVILVFLGMYTYNQGGQLALALLIFVYIARFWLFPPRGGASTWRPEP